MFSHEWCTYGIKTNEYASRQAGFGRTFSPRRAIYFGETYNRGEVQMNNVEQQVSAGIGYRVQRPHVFTTVDTSSSSTNSITI